MKNIYSTLAYSRDFNDEELFQAQIKRIPVESRANVRFLFDGNLLDIDDAIIDAQACLFAEDDDQALEILEEKIEQLEEINPESEDSHFFYYSLQHKQEEYLFECLDHSGKTLFYAKENYSLLYQTYGAVLLAQGNIAEAREYFEKSLKWNPYDLETRLFVIETYKMENRMDLFYHETKKLLKMAISSKCLSVIYQNMAYYFLEKKDYKSAMYTLLMSTDYGLDPDPYFMDLVEKVEQKKGNEPIPTEQEIYSHFISEGIPVPPDDDLYEFLFEKALDLEQEELQEAMFCLNMLEDIKNSLEKENEDEIRIRKKYNRKVGNLIHKYQEIPMAPLKSDILEKLMLTKVYVPFIKNIEGMDEFPCELVENNEGDVFLPMFIFPSKIPQRHKKDFEMREVAFEFGLGVLSQWDEVDGIVIHPFSHDSFEIRKEEIDL